MIPSFAGLFFINQRCEKFGVDFNILQLPHELIFDVDSLRKLFERELVPENVEFECEFEFDLRNFFYDGLFFKVEKNETLTWLCFALN